MASGNSSGLHHGFGFDIFGPLFVVVTKVLHEACTSSSRNQVRRRHMDTARPPSNQPETDTELGFSPRLANLSSEVDEYGEMVRRNARRAVGQKGPAHGASRKAGGLPR